MANHTSGYPKLRIGFHPEAPIIRMEEEEAPEASAPFGRASLGGQWAASVSQPDFDRLMQERERILNSIKIEDLTPKDKFRLLEENRAFMIILRGGSPYKFGTEKVIYSILIFSGVVIITLACLTAFAHLEKEVTITFVGTVVGATIATIAQKLGKIGR